MDVPAERGAEQANGHVVAVDLSHFITEALLGEVVKEQRALADGTTVWCYVIRTYSEPHEHEMGPWSPKTITDDADAGGIWVRDDLVGCPQEKPTNSATGLRIGADLL